MSIIVLSWIRLQKAKSIPTVLKPWANTKHPDNPEMLYLAWSDGVDARHTELVLDALLQAGDLLVVDVGVGDEDVGELVLVQAAVADPAIPPRSTP